MLCSPQIIWPMFEPNSLNSKKRTPCSISPCRYVNPSFLLDIRTWRSVCIAWGVFALAMVCMRMPSDTTNELSPSEKLRFPCSILTGPSSWRTLRRSLPLVAAPPKPPTTPYKRKQLAKNTPLTKLLRSDSALPSQSRDRLRVFIDRPGVPPLFCFPMNFTARTHRHHHDHGHLPRALGGS